MERVKTYILNRLRKYRILAGFKQHEVAKVLGHSNASRISLWEKGECMPGTENLFWLSALYGVPQDILYPDYKEDIVLEVAQTVQRLFPERVAFSLPQPIPLVANL